MHMLPKLITQPCTQQRPCRLNTSLPLERCRGPPTQQTPPPASHGGHPWGAAPPAASWIGIQHTPARPSAPSADNQGSPPSSCPPRCHCLHSHRRRCRPLRSLHHQDAYRLLPRCFPSLACQSCCLPCGWRRLPQQTCRAPCRKCGRGFPALALRRCCRSKGLSWPLACGSGSMCTGPSALLQACFVKRGERLGVHFLPFILSRASLSAFSSSWG